MIFKKIKIKVQDPKHSEQIQEVMFKLGYRWLGRNGEETQCHEKEVLYGDEDGSITHSNLGYFDHVPENEEVFLYYGELVPACYFTQPTTEPKEEIYAPLPIQPFNQWAIDRMKLLAQHIAHQLDKGQVAEQALVRQLHVLNTLCIECEKEGM